MWMVTQPCLSASDLSEVKIEMSYHVMEDFLDRHVLVEERVPAMRVIHAALPLIRRDALGQAQDTPISLIEELAQRLPIEDSAGDARAKSVDGVEQACAGIEDGRESLRIDRRQASQKTHEWDKHWDQQKSEGHMEQYLTVRPTGI